MADENKATGSLEERSPEGINLDVKDRKILFELSINARFSSTYIAKQVGLSREVVDYRIKSLIQRKILNGFIAQINPERLGMTGHIVYLELTKPGVEDEVVKYLVEHPKTVWVASCLGKWQIAFSVISKSNIEFGSIYDAMTHDLHDKIKDQVILSGLKEGKLPYYHLVEGLEHKETAKYERKDNSFQKQLVEKKEFLQAAMDETDQKILATLMKDAKIELLTLAQKVNLSSSAVYNRIEKLVQMGVITGFMPLISFHALGLEWFMTLIHFKNLTPRLENGLLTEIYYHAYVLWYVRCLGKWNLQLSVFSKDSAHYSKMMKTIISKFTESIHSYDFVIITKQHKFVYG